MRGGSPPTGGRDEHKQGNQTVRSLGLLCLELVPATPTFGQRGADSFAWTIRSREAEIEHGISK